MIYSLVFHEMAQKDYEEALNYYLENSLKAGEAYVFAVDKALGLICEHPQRWRNVYKNFHEINIRKFPFSIIYVVEPQNFKIIVTSIYHHKRNPQKKYLK